jgi:uncharacterized protein YndB with AHSA1/START domain/uncharacterized damage-inducible protein DinB
MTNLSIDDAVVEELLIRATPERIFRALTDPEELIAWWGSPETYRCRSWELDLAVGGAWRCSGQNAAGQPFSVEGRYLEVEPPRRLAFTWRASWVDAPETRVRIELAPEAGGTRLVWTHSGFSGYPRALEDHRGGLPAVVGWLGDFSQRRSRSLIPQLQHPAQLIELNLRLYGRALDGVGEDEAWRRPGPSSSPLHWIAGHLVRSRADLLRALGGAWALDWGDRFARGEEVASPADYPSLDEVQWEWRGVSAALLDRLPDLDASFLASPAPRRLPVEDRSMAGLVSFSVYHESYHVGQLGYLRKWLGRPGLVDGPRPR